MGDGFIRSLSCEGVASCDGVRASPVSGDLICQGNVACRDILVDFNSDVPGEHAITCDGLREQACTNSIFRIDGVSWCQDHGKSCYLCVCVCFKEMYDVCGSFTYIYIYIDNK